ncbi:MAG: hypothetical protein JO271_12185 [Verrucomicrobia bacterium]|nr:hypothetical protein [Verrucomicrobiota bacterium]
MLRSGLTTEQELYLFVRPVWIYEPNHVEADLITQTGSNLANPTSFIDRILIPEPILVEYYYNWPENPRFQSGRFKFNCPGHSPRLWDFIVL